MLYTAIIAGLVLAGVSSTPAWAQENDDDEAQSEVTEAQDQQEEDQEGEDTLDRVQVTGSLLRREDFSSVSPMQVITAETQFQAGQLTTSDVLQNSTVASGTTQLNNQFGGFVVQGGTGVQTLDLRGLGTTRTLTLLNGRRPGGSGTRGQVQAVDLSMIPDIAVNRFEVVLDGSSSIYGSDAVAGVANIITRRSVDRSEVNVSADVPIDGGGEFYRLGAITGANFDNGSMTFSAQLTKREALRTGDRDFLGCSQDMVRDSSGNRIDREDRSSIAGTEGAGCYNMWYDSIIDAATGTRWITSPDGEINGPFPGRRARQNNAYDEDPLGEAWYETVRFGDFLLSESAINEQERMNVYATADFTFGDVEWDADVLYSNRETTRTGWRQFFPLIGGAQAASLFGTSFYSYDNDPDYNPVDPAASPVEGQLTQPIYPYPLNSNIDVDYYFASTGLSGELPTSNYWSWRVQGSYSRSDGDYAQNAIDQSRSGDVQYDPNPPTYDPFDPALLDGSGMSQLIDAVGANTLGNTVYDQWTVSGILAGDLFELPAGTVGTAFGVEYRDFSIDDNPDPLSQAGQSWGLTSATVTKGSNNVSEAFAEVEVPILAGVPGFESLTFNGSARYFDYDRGGDDVVWKAGLNWQIVPTVRLRSTVGTSYRAPALFEQFLGDQTGFQGQALDPCIEWEDSTNENVRNNCAAAGIPSDYAGVGSSITVISGGGVENLESETSDATNFGIVWTPEFTNLNVALDWYQIEVNDQIAQLGASAIASGCYTGENFPNQFCELIERNSGDDPTGAYNIASINDSFVNINTQKVEGLDLNMTWQGDFDWGSLNVESQTTRQRENLFQLFAPGTVAGFDDLDVVGDIGTPEIVSNLRATAQRGDWSATYYTQYASSTDASRFADEEINYFGEENAVRDIKFDAWWQHNLSILYRQDKWDLLIGINNLFNEEPDLVSAGAAGAVSTRGNVPINGTQASLLGRRVFGRINYRF
ncbi:TonB-dependent receptor [Wenzhouxiangella sp. 15181]|nr:TonB-dependent receptor [Wenzhouxiangella sp. 15181]